jgi:hypothetical protein
VLADFARELDELLLGLVLQVVRDGAIRMKWTDKW